MSKANKDIKELAERLAGLGPLLPGATSLQGATCRKPGCKCMNRKNAQTHGPYLKLSYNVGGSHGVVHIKDKDRAAVERMTANYREAREIVTKMALIGVETLKAGGTEALEAFAFPPTPSAAPGDVMRKIEASRGGWKSKARERHAALEADRIKIRDLTASREKWRGEALAARRTIAEAEGRIAKLEKELDGAKKNSRLQPPRLRHPKNHPATPTR